MRTKSQDVSTVRDARPAALVLAAAVLLVAGQHSAERRRTRERSKDRALVSRLGAELSAIERITDPAARSPFGDTVAYAGVVVAAVVGVAGLVAYVWQFEDEPVVAWAFVLIGPVIGLALLLVLRAAVSDRRHQRELRVRQLVRRELRALLPRPS